MQCHRKARAIPPHPLRQTHRKRPPRAVNAPPPSASLKKRNPQNPQRPQRTHHWAHAALQMQPWQLGPLPQSQQKLAVSAPLVARGLSPRQLGVLERPKGLDSAPPDHLNEEAQAPAVPPTKAVTENPAKVPEPPPALEVQGDSPHPKPVAPREHSPRRMSPTQPERPGQTPGHWR